MTIFMYSSYTVRLDRPLFILQVKILVQKDSGQLRTALTTNLKSAVLASFLMLPESFSEEDLYLQIAGLSYSGEPSYGRV